jgi:AcrR family transcriptional regulator
MSIPLSIAILGGIIAVMTARRPQRLSREERRSQTREQLLDAAAVVFNRLGYHGASLEEVAAEAGFTKGAVYSNFATKADLFFALAARIAAQRHAAITEAYRDLSLSATLGDIGPYLGTQAETEEAIDLLTIEFWLAAMRDPTLRARLADDLARTRAAIAAILADKLEAEKIEPGFTPGELATILKALGDGMLMQIYLDPDAIDRALVGRAFRMILGLPAPGEGSAESGGAGVSLARGSRGPGDAPVFG